MNMIYSITNIDEMVREKVQYIADMNIKYLRTGLIALIRG